MGSMQTLTSSFLGKDLIFQAQGIPAHPELFQQSPQNLILSINTNRSILFHFDLGGKNSVKTRFIFNLNQDKNGFGNAKNDHHFK